MMYRDALAVIRTLGRPAFFVTTTRNPHWPGVRDALSPGQRRKDRPELLARVFPQYAEEILRCIVRDKVQGDAVTHCLVIEFQKRGLPRAHIALIATPETLG